MAVDEFLDASQRLLAMIATPHQASLRQFELWEAMSDVLDAFRRVPASLIEELELEPILVTSIGAAEEMLATLFDLDARMGPASHASRRPEGFV